MANSPEISRFQNGKQLDDDPWTVLTRAGLLKLATESDTAPEPATNADESPTELEPTGTFWDDVENLSGLVKPPQTTDPEDNYHKAGGALGWD